MTLIDWMFEHPYLTTFICFCACVAVGYSFKFMVLTNNYYVKDDK